MIVSFNSVYFFYRLSFIYVISKVSGSITVQYTYTACAASIILPY